MNYLVREDEFEKWKKVSNLTEVVIFDPMNLENDPFYKTLSNLCYRIKEHQLFNFFKKYMSAVEIVYDNIIRNNKNDDIIFKITFLNIALTIYFICDEHRGFIRSILFDTGSEDVYKDDFNKDERADIADLINGYIRIYDTIYNSPDNKSFERELIFEIIRKYPGISISHPYLNLINTSFIFSDGERYYNDKGNNITGIVSTLVRGNWKNRWFFNKNETILKSYGSDCEIRLL